MRKAVVIFVFATGSAFAQVGLDAEPLAPLLPSRALNPGAPIVPLTDKEKAVIAMKNTFGPRALLNRALFSGIDQLTDSPYEWPGTFEGYGMRLGASMGRLAVRNSLMLAGNVALNVDPRYDRCDCSGALPRMGHAIKRVLVARKDGGGQIVNVPRIAGGYLTPIITNQWMPDRYNNWTNHHQNGTTHLAWTAFGNMIREFWPEISTKMPFRKK